MNARQRELALQATTRLQLGNIKFGPSILPRSLDEREFKAQFCKENGITEEQLTAWVKQLLAGG